MYKPALDIRESWSQTHFVNEKSWNYANKTRTLKYNAYLSPLPLPFIKNRKRQKATRLWERRVDWKHFAKKIKIKSWRFSNGSPENVWSSRIRLWMKYVTVKFVRHRSSQTRWLNLHAFVIFAILLYWRLTERKRNKIITKRRVLIEFYSTEYLKNMSGHVYIFFFLRTYRGTPGTL